MASAECNSAIRQITNLRYEGTVHGEGFSLLSMHWAHEPRQIEDEHEKEEIRIKIKILMKIRKVTNISRNRVPKWTIL